MLFFNIDLYMFHKINLLTTTELNVSRCKLLVVSVWRQLECLYLPNGIGHRERIADPSTKAR